MNSNDNIVQTVQRVLESWAMMFVEPVESSLSCFNPEQPLFISQVNYQGPTSGSFWVIVQEPFIKALTANLLDDGDEDDGTLIIDGAKELANLISGNLLTELFGIEKAYALEAPTVSITETSSVNIAKLPYLTCFKADDCPVALSFSLE